MAVTRKDLDAMLGSLRLPFDPAALDEERPLADQDVDSLDRFNLFLKIEETLGVKIRDEDLPGLRSLRDVLAFLNARTEGRAGA